MFVAFQIGIRIWFRLRPQAIPYGWSWLLENPWRKAYRNPQRTADQSHIHPSDTVLEVGCGSGLFTRALASCCTRLIDPDLEPRYVAETRAKTQDLSHLEFTGQVWRVPHGVSARDPDHNFLCQYSVPRGCS